MSKQPKRSLKKRILIGLFKLAAAGVGAFILLILLVWLGVFGHMPNRDEIASIRNHLASEVYSSDGKLMGKYFIQNRTGAELEEMPQDLLDALVATEDARFYEHNGIDYRSLGRVLFKTILMGDASSGGGSTITQQLVKNTYGRPSHGFLTVPIAKIRETILAGRVEDVFDKRQILHLYLNTVSFGENIYGVETAAQRYFNAKPSELSTEECAVLVGLLKGNTLYNPRRNPELAQERRNVVLAQMAKYEYLSEAERDSLQAIPLELNYYNLESENPAPYFIAHIEDEIIELLDDVRKPDGSEYDLYTDGLIIETTIDSRLQDYANSAVERHMKTLQNEFNRHWANSAPWGRNTNVIRDQIKKTGVYKRLVAQGLSEEEIEAELKKTHTMVVVDPTSEDGHRVVEMSALDSVAHYQSLLHPGFVAIQPETGNVLAWVGGHDFQYLPYDHVTTRRQTASTFKPFVYGAALESGMDNCTYFRNIQKAYPQFDGWSPANAGADDSLYYNLRGALKRSLNVISVEILFETGMDNVRDFAQRAGITSPIRKIPSMALGTNEATLFEMVHAYSTFANNGMRMTPRFITKITDAFGNVLYQAPGPQGKQTLKYEDIVELNQMMQSVVREGTGSSAYSVYGLSNRYAGKTGTAQDYADGWFIGFTPKLVAGVWVGASSPSVHFRSGSLGAGSHMALPIWARFMKSVELSRMSRFNGSFANPSDSLVIVDCPDVREPDLLERIGNWFEGDERTVDTIPEADDESPSFWDRLLGRDDG